MMPAIRPSTTAECPEATHEAVWTGPWGGLRLRGSAHAITGARFDSTWASAASAAAAGQPAPALPAPWTGCAPIPLVVSGTAFRVRVWQALATLVCGELVSYRELAARIDHPRAVRAVASAVAANPIPLLIPCHRVIRSDGRYGDYVGGSARKHLLIEWEKTSICPATTPQ